MNKIRLVFVAMVFVFLQACNRSELKAENPIQEAEAVKTELPSEPIEIKVGDNLTETLAKIKVKNSKLKVVNLSSIINDKSSMIILVKPGCVFCESLLAIMNSQKTKAKPQLIIALDGAHANAEEFKAKFKKNNNIKAEWIYDYTNKFHDELSMSSFPRLLYLDKKQNVIENQIGLKLPEDKASLEGLEFPVILQKLSVGTVDWIEDL
ncbi:MAG: hypothetical protein HOA17_03410 [Candidatus Melainabacteria bacterium]|jgi:thioredoxin-related protein|nr:hypothetical protein [Candidatus Melainabacteria bacterium]